MTRISILLLAVALIAWLPGCSGRPGRVAPPDYASDAGAVAVSQYDTNGDGAIADEEVDAVPGLRASLEQIDSDGDGRLTVAEIDARVQSWRDNRVAEMTVMCQVFLDGDPLSGAQVEFEPESFMGSSVPSAFATTDDDGGASVSMTEEYLAAPPYPGVACGWYKIRVTSDLQEIPAHYNSTTTLGCEIAKDAHWVEEDVIQITLTSVPR